MSKVYKQSKDAAKAARKVVGKAAVKGVHFAISGDKDSGFSWSVIEGAPPVETPPAPKPEPVAAAPLSAAVPSPAEISEVEQPKKPVKVSRIKAKVKTKIDARRGRKPLERVSDVSGKRLLMFKLISRDKGASLSHLSNALGWQYHTVRGAVSTIASQFGVRIKSFKDDRRGRVYKAQPKGKRAA